MNKTTIMIYLENIEFEKICLYETLKSIVLSVRFCNPGIFTYVFFFSFHCFFFSVYDLSHKYYILRLKKKIVVVDYVKITHVNGTLFLLNLLIKSNPSSITTFSLEKERYVYIKH